MDYLYGQTAWKFKVDKNSFTDKAKFDKLAEQARLVHEELQRSLDVANKNRLTF